MTKTKLWVWGSLAAIAISTDAGAQTSIENQNGIAYQVTRTNKSIPVTSYQPQTSKTYQPQTTTQYHSYQQTYVAPVTQYQWVQRYRNWWNPFGRPYWTTELEPVTRWQAQQGTVQVPVNKTEWVEHTTTAMVPVTTYQTVTDEHRVALGPVANGGGASAIATRPVDFGGQQMTGDPPRSTGTYR